MLSDIRHVKASDAERESIRQDIMKTRERLLNVRISLTPCFLSTIIFLFRIVLDSPNVWEH